MFDLSHRQNALNKLMKLEYVFEPAQPVATGMHIYGDCDFVNNEIKKA